MSAILAVMAAENLDREDLSPIEEARSIDALVTAITDEGGWETGPAPKEVIEQAAAKLGRSVKYVQGRLNLLRLSTKCRKMLSAGTMLLGHALELAKLVDHEKQDKIAGMIHWSEDGARCYMSIGEIRGLVTKELTSLRGTPWELGVAFAGLQVCTVCEHNSDNAEASLFDGKGDKRPEARCLNPACYNRKASQCTKDLRKAVGRTVTLAKKTDAEQPRAGTAHAREAMEKAKVQHLKPGKTLFQ